MATSLRQGAMFFALIATANLTAIAPASAAIITVQDPNFWLTSSDETLTNLGLDFIDIPESSAPLQTDLTTLSSPLGNIQFSPAVNKRKIGNGWLSWSQDYQGEVYFTKGATTLDITLPNLMAFDFYAEPDVQLPFKISAIAKSGKASNLLEQLVNGNAGAKYFGFYSDDPLDPIESIQITADPQSKGFAIAQLRGATATVPSPALLPGMIAFGLGIWRKNRSGTNID